MGIIEELKAAFQRFKAAVDPFATSDRLHVIAQEVHDASVKAIEEAHAIATEAKNEIAALKAKLAALEVKLGITNAVSPAATATTQAPAPAAPVSTITVLNTDK